MPTPNPACPVCETAFNEKEAVLRCAGCGQVLHPGCWIENGGCATKREHAMRPEPVAWPPPAQVTGARPAPSRTVPGPVPPAPQRTRHEPALTGATSRRTSGARQAEQASAPMPGLYRSKGILRYWFVPVAVLLSIGVAAGVIYAGDLLIGGDESDSTPAAFPSPTVPATGVASPSPTAVATPPPGVLAVGATATVVNTGECLNIRSEPSTSGAQLACLVDGTPVEIVEGPIVADGYEWFNITSEFGDGWAAGDYLQPGAPAAQ